MAYTPTEWKSGDKVTSEKLNNIEQGIVANEQGIAGVTDIVDNAVEYYGIGTATEDEIVNVDILAGDWNGSGGEYTYTLETDAQMQVGDRITLVVGDLTYSLVADVVPFGVGVIYEDAEENITVIVVNITPEMSMGVGIMVMLYSTPEAPPETSSLIITSLVRDTIDAIMIGRTYPKRIFSYGVSAAEWTDQGEELTIAISMSPDTALAVGDTVTVSYGDTVYSGVADNNPEVQGSASVFFDDGSIGVYMNGDALLCEVDKTEFAEPPELFVITIDRPHTNKIAAKYLELPSSGTGFDAIITDELAGIELVSGNFTDAFAKVSNGQPLAIYLIKSGVSCMSISAAITDEVAIGIDAFYVDASNSNTITATPKYYWTSTGVSTTAPK